MSFKCRAILKDISLEDTLIGDSYERHCSEGYFIRRHGF